MFSKEEVRSVHMQGQFSFGITMYLKTLKTPIRHKYDDLWLQTQRKLQLKIQTIFCLSKNSDSIREISQVMHCHKDHTTEEFFSMWLMVENKLNISNLRCIFIFMRLCEILASVQRVLDSSNHTTFYRE